MKVGIVISDSNDWTARALMASFTKRCIEGIFLDFSELISGICRSFSIKSCGVDLLDLDAIVVRDLGRRGAVDVSFRFEALTSIEEMGVPIINPPEAIARAANKFATSRRLYEEGVTTPRTVVTTSPRVAEEALCSLKKAVSKPLFGYKGRDIVLLKSSEPSDVERLKSIIQKQGLVYLQEFVEVTSARPRDIRAFVVDGRVQGAIYRIAPPGQWISNLARGGMAAPCPLTEEIESLAGKAANAVGAVYCGVDLLETRQGLTVIEVNGTPSGRGIFEALGVDVTEAIAEHVSGLPG